MKTTPTIVMFFLAVLGVAAMVYVERSGPSRSVAAGPGARQRLLAPDRFPVDSVDQIELRRGTEVHLVVEQDSGRWRQVAPFEHPMDAFSMRQFITLASQLEAVDVVHEDDLRGGQSRAALGLDPPLATVRFAWPAGSVELRLGRAGIAGRAYVQLEDDARVYIVSSELHDRAVRMDPREWRDRAIFQDVSVDADSVLMEAGSSRILLERDRKEWRLAEPVRTRMDDLARDDFFQALGRARVSGFILDQPADAEKFGLASPAGTLTITSTRPGSGNPAEPRDHVSQKLLLGARLSSSRQDRYAMIEGRPVVVQLSPEVIAALFRRAEALVAPTASGMVPADVKAVVIRTTGPITAAPTGPAEAPPGASEVNTGSVGGAGTEFRLERHLEDWVAVDRGMREVSPPLVEELLEQLTTLRAPAVVIRPYSRELEVATVTLFGFDARPRDTVRILFDPSQRKWAMENGDDVLRVFPESLKLRLAPADYGLPAAGE